MNPPLFWRCLCLRDISQIQPTQHAIKNGVCSLKDILDIHSSYKILPAWVTRRDSVIRKFQAEAFEIMDRLIQSPHCMVQNDKIVGPGRRLAKCQNQALQRFLGALLSMKTDNVSEVRPRFRHPKRCGNVPLGFPQE